MLTVEELEKKVAELAVQVEQSAANHHVLLGSKMTYDSLLLQAKKAAEVVKEVAEVTEAVADAMAADGFKQ